MLIVKLVNCADMVSEIKASFKKMFFSVFSSEKGHQKNIVNQDHTQNVKCGCLTYLPNNVHQLLKWNLKLAKLLSSV